MPDNSKKAILEDLTDEDYIKIARHLDELGITDNINEIYRVSGRILGYGVDFMKKIGVLSEFVRYLPHLESEVFVEMYKQRPKMYGGNPFD